MKSFDTGEKKLYNSYVELNCLNDGTLDAEICDPWTVTNSYNASSDTSSETIWEKCKVLNPSSVCAARICSIEGNFVDRLVDYYMSTKTTDGSDDSKYLQYYVQE